MSNPFKRAQRQGIRLRLALTGPSGSGKTYWGLGLAAALARATGHDAPAVLDTEHGSAARYADLWAFDTFNLQNTHPKHYCRALDLAAEAGYGVMLIDSLSHAWCGPEGAIALLDQAKKNHGGNSFAAWADITPLHNKLIETLLSSSLHLIATMRVKTEYAIDDDRGRSVPRKVGLAPVQRDGMEYEFDIIVELGLDHTATVGKTRCTAIDGCTFEPDQLDDLADILIAWTRGDELPEPPAPRTRPQPEATDDDPLGDTAEPATNGQVVADDDPLAEEAPPQASGDDPLAEQADDDPLAEQAPPKNRRQPRGKQAAESSPWHGDDPIEPAEQHSDHDTVARLCAMYAGVHDTRGLNGTDKERDAAVKAGKLIKKDDEKSAWAGVARAREIAVRREELVTRLVAGYGRVGDRGAMQPLAKAIQTAVQEGMLVDRTAPMEVVTGARLVALAGTVQTAEGLRALQDEVDAAQADGNLIPMSDEFEAIMQATRAAEERVGQEVI